MSAIDSPQSVSHLLVDFFYGDASAAHYCSNLDHAADDAATGYTYVPVRALEAKIPKNTGVFENVPATIVLPISDAFTTLVTAGDPVSPIRVAIYEVNDDPLNPGPTTYCLFRGKVSRSVKNYQGKKGVVSIECASAKQLLSVPLGIVCNQQCAWTLGGAGCKIDLGPVTHTGLCTGVNVDRTITITGLPGAPDATYYRNGSVVFDSLVIPIRDWAGANPTTFLMRDRPPASWVGKTVTVVPGCDKSVGNCENRWANLGQFGGFGVGMPDYHPIIEG